MEFGTRALQPVISKFYPSVLPTTDVGVHKLKVSLGIILFKHSPALFRLSFNIYSKPEFLTGGFLCVVSISVARASSLVSSPKPEFVLSLEG